MKMTKAHYQYIESAINSMLGDNKQNIATQYETGQFAKSDKVKDLQKRFCFDLFYAAGLTQFSCSQLYSYLDDSHIYTALKTICPTVVRKY